MAVEIITGHTGKEHVTAEAAGALHAGVIGTGKYVLAGGNQFAAEIVSNNLIKIKSGELINQGRHMRIPVNSYEEVTIQNGAQGMHRSDLIVMRYKKDTSAQVESAELVVIKGKASSSIQTSVPSYVNGNILSGATQDDFPLYRVSLSGLTITSVTKLFSVSPTIEMLSKRIDDIGKVSTAKLLTEFQCETNMITKTADGMVSLSVYMHTGAIGGNAGTWWTAGTIPEGYRPNSIVYGTGMVCGDGWLNAVPTAFMISNGLLYLYGQNSAATMLVINMAYAVAGSVVA